MSDNPFAVPVPTVSDNPFAVPVTQEETEGYKQRFYDGTTAGEIAEGIVAGGVGIVEGVVGGAAAITDVATGGDLAGVVADAADAVRDTLELDPEGIAGQGARIITQYVAPASKASRMSKQRRMRKREAEGKGNVPETKRERINSAFEEIAAAGLADVAVSSDEDKTALGDWVGIGMLETTDLMGLDGRAKALARLGNKFKAGADGLLIGGALQGVFKLAGRTKTGQGIAAATRETIDNVTDKLQALDIRRMTDRPGSSTELSAGGKYLADFIASARYRGYLPGQVADKRLKIDNIIAQEVKVAEKNIKDLESSIAAAVKELPESNGKLDDVAIMDRIENYLTEAAPLEKAKIRATIPKNIVKKADDMRKHIDSLSKNIQKSNFIKEKDFTPPGGQSVSQIIEGNIGSYLRRTYKAVEDAKYVPTEESIKAANGYFRRNNRMLERELTDLVRRDAFNEEFTQKYLKENGLEVVGSGKTLKVKLRGKPTDSVVNKARENFYSRYALKSRAGAGDWFSLGTTTRIAENKLDGGLFKGRKSLPKDLARLLGQVKDPKEAYMSTVADLAQFSAVDDYFGTIKKLAETNSGVGRFFKKPKDDFQKEELIRRGYVKIGKDGDTTGAKGKKVKNAGDVLAENGGWGTLDGFYVPKQIYNNLTKATLADSGPLMNGLKAAYGGLLRLKGISQYSKTVLSPLTQVRNFTTASAFALANGNVPIYGRGENWFRDSNKAIFADLFNKGDQAVFNDLYEAQRRGVLGTSAELREIQDNLSKGIGMKPTTTGSDVLLGGLGKGKKVIETVFQTKKLEKLYQASDDYWKYFNYQAEQAKLKRALEGATDQQKIDYLTKNGKDVSVEAQALLRKGDANLDELIKDRAAQIVIDTVPNYNKGASDLIKVARTLPVGNFITFPAEMLRTSFNIVKQGLDDLASDIPGVQARGRQRLVGMAATTAIIPIAAQELAYGLSGVSREEMAAYKRSFGAPWEKGGILLPINKDPETGKVKYINFSTSNPYDVISRFVNRAINESDNAIKTGADPSQAFEKVVIGTAKEFLDPFIAESIITEAAVDLIFREGRTATGARIFIPEEDAATRAYKSVLHILETITPNLVPINISSGDIEASRFLRSAVGTEGGVIDVEDKMGRKYNLGAEIFRQLSGVSPLEFDPQKGAFYSAGRLERAQTGAKAIFNSVIDNANASTSQMNNALRRSQEAKYRVDKEYFQVIEDLRKMGLDDGDIYSALKKETQINPKDIYGGEFVPFKLSPSNLKDLRNTGNIEKFDGDYYGELLDAMKGLSLIPDQGPVGRTKYERPSTSPVEVQPPAPSDNPFKINTPPAPNPFAVPSIDQSNAGPAPFLNTITTARAPGPVNPALLGDNPADQAANAAIANRLG